MVGNLVALAGGNDEVGVMEFNEGEGAGVSFSLFRGCRVSKNRGTKNGAKVGNLPPTTGTGTGKPTCTGVGDGVRASTSHVTDLVEDKIPFPPQIMASVSFKHSSAETDP